MTKNISIIGLGQVGASIGLALGAAGKEYYRIGYDRDVKAGPQAVKEELIDKSSFNLPAAVEKADFVVLAVSAFELKPALSVIGPVLKEGAVVIDTSALKQAALVWASETIPAGRWFVSISPTLNPLFFSETKPGADLFKNGLAVVTAGKGTPEAVIDSVIELIELLGAKVQFSDPLEHDGLMAGVHQLPEIAAAALFQTISNQPGWLESRKMAGASFANISAPLRNLASQEAPADGLFQNQDNALRFLDHYITTLNDLRDLIAEDKTEEVNAFFARAAASRQTWQEQRYKAEWERNVAPTQAPDFMTRIFGSGGKPRKK